MVEVKNQSQQTVARDENEPKSFVAPKSEIPLEVIEHEAQERLNEKPSGEPLVVLAKDSNLELNEEGLLQPKGQSLKKDESLDKKSKKKDWKKDDKKEEKKDDKGIIKQVEDASSSVVESAKDMTGLNKDWNKEDVKEVMQKASDSISKNVNSAVESAKDMTGWNDQQKDKDLKKDDNKDENKGLIQQASETASNVVEGAKNLTGWNNNNKEEKQEDKDDKKDWKEKSEEPIQPTNDDDKQNEGLIEKATETIGSVLETAKGLLGFGGSNNDEESKNKEDSSDK
ncbi:hypothetical protein ABK040_005912 [Willaertia magna]